MHNAIQILRARSGHGIPPETTRLNDSCLSTRVDREGERAHSTLHEIFEYLMGLLHRGAGCASPGKPSRRHTGWLLGPRPWQIGRQCCAEQIQTCEAACGQPVHCISNMCAPSDVLLRPEGTGGDAHLPRLRRRGAHAQAVAICASAWRTSGYTVSCTCMPHVKSRCDSSGYTLLRSTAPEGSASRRSSMSCGVDRMSLPPAAAPLAIAAAGTLRCTALPRQDGTHQTHVSTAAARSWGKCRRALVT